jgi:hypothetical protein
MLAAFDILSTDSALELPNPKCEFRCLCKDATCPSDRVSVDAVPLKDLSGEFAQPLVQKGPSSIQFMMCASKELLDCSGDNLPGRIVAVFSYYAIVSGSQQSILNQKTVDLEYVVKRPIGMFAIFGYLSTAT